MLWQKLVTIAACAAVATSLGSTTQAHIQSAISPCMRALTSPTREVGLFPAIASRSLTRQPHGTPCQPPIA